MKTLTISLAAVFVFSLGIPGSFAEEKGKESAKKVEAQEKGGLHDWMASFWARVTKVGKRVPSNVPTSVAGLRGTEQEKGKELTPYWKGKEKTKDGAAMAKAESSINKKNFVHATEILKSFGQTYPDSPLKPIAALSLAYCYAEAGMSNEARVTFEGFLKDYPNHELAADARAGIELLKGETQ